MGELARWHESFFGADGGFAALIRAAYPKRSPWVSGSVDCLRWELGPPGDADACRRDGVSLSRTLWMTLRVARWDGDPTDEDAHLNPTWLEGRVSAGEIPWPTPEGTFVVDGEDHLVDPALERTGPVYLSDGVTIVPRRGPQLTLQRDEDTVHVSLDGRSVSIGALLRTFGVRSVLDAATAGWERPSLHRDASGRWTRAVGLTEYRQLVATVDLTLPDGTIVVRRGERVRDGSDLLREAGVIRPTLAEEEAADEELQEAEANADPELPAPLDRRYVPWDPTGELCATDLVDGDGVVRVPAGGVIPADPGPGELRCETWYLPPVLRAWLDAMRSGDDDLRATLIDAYELPGPGRRELNRLLAEVANGREGGRATLDADDVVGLLQAVAGATWDVDGDESYAETVEAVLETWYADLVDHAAGSQLERIFLSGEEVTPADLARNMTHGLWENIRSHPQVPRP